ncbi:MAG TPA: crossover junction endodeoxyribonuclease RuvC [Gammaproteobacteria bacterium]|nr:crossover junction endodeoxyribonuclease RuvC [Gammaproteobacteria bacterium]
MAVTRILGIDPGSLLTGYGVVDHDGRDVKHVTSGCIRMHDKSFPERLREIFFGVQALVAEFTPQELAIEQAFVHKNADSALKLGQARAAAICATLESGLAVFEYTPRAVKQAVVGRGAASKEQVQHMMRILLGLRGKLQADSADALAVAVCHAHSRELKARLAGHALVTERLS